MVIKCLWDKLKMADALDYHIFKMHGLKVTVEVKIAIAIYAENFLDMCERVGPQCPDVSIFKP